MEKLRENNILWYKLHVFIFDLRNFRSNTESQARLESVEDLLYIGQPYFTHEEATTLRNTVIGSDGETLEKAIDSFFTTRLQKRLGTRMAKTNDYRVCAAHDLAPIFEKAFRVNSKDLAKNKAFCAMMSKRGLHALDDGGVWKGLGQR